MNKEFEELINTIANNLGQIQLKFNEYQYNHFPQRSPEFFCLELNGEAGELANLEKKQWKGRDVNPLDYQYESADVFIALMNYVNSRNIDLKSAVIDKLGKIEEIRLERKAELKEY
ncbi:MAG TPA: hypothetical protein P5216_04785 [Bacteroidota bacterium]|nr:hypothetical protein [Bacteroidota bacterium]